MAKTESPAAARVLVTGSTGFLGRHVVRAAKAAGLDVVEISKTRGFDLVHEGEATAAVLLSKPDFVIHLAASPMGQDRPAAAYREDVQMGMNVIHAAVMARAKAILVSPSGNGEDEPHRALLSMLQSCRRQYGMPFGCLVLPEVYGSGDRPGRGRVRRLVATLGTACFEAARAGVPTLKMPMAEKEPVPLVHAEDAARAVIFAMRVVDDDRPLEIPPSETPLLSELSGAVAACAGWKGSFLWNGHAANAREIDGERAAKLLKWRPGITLKDGLPAAVDSLRLRPLA